jgi:hypothetical protein
MPTHFGLAAWVISHRIAIEDETAETPLRGWVGLVIVHISSPTSYLQKSSAIIAVWFEIVISIDFTYGGSSRSRGTSCPRFQRSWLFYGSDWRQYVLSFSL